MAQKSLVLSKRKKLLADGSLTLAKTIIPVQSHALDDYLESFGGKDLENTRRRIEAIIRPQVGGHDASKLTSKIITDWHLALANAPARLRTAPGAVQNYRSTADTFEARRSRRSNANRILTNLNAALNDADRNEKIADNHA